MKPKSIVFGLLMLGSLIQPPTVRAQDCLEEVRNEFSQAQSVNLEVKILGDPKESSRQILENKISNCILLGLRTLGYTKKIKDLSEPSASKIIVELAYSAIGAQYTKGFCWAAWAYQGTVTFVTPQGCRYTINIANSVQPSTYIASCAKEKQDASFDFKDQDIVDVFNHIYGEKYTILQQYYTFNHDPAKFMAKKYSPRQLLSIVINSLHDNDQYTQIGASRMLVYALRFYYIGESLRRKTKLATYLGDEFYAEVDTFLKSALETQVSEVIAYAFEVMKVIGHLPDKKVVFDEIERKNIKTLEAASWLLVGQIEMKGAAEFEGASTLVYKAHTHIQKLFDTEKCQKVADIDRALTILLCKLNHHKKEQARKEYNESVKRNKCKSLTIDSRDCE